MTTPDDAVVDLMIESIKSEYHVAQRKHRAVLMRNFHEAYGILKEEVDEFWDAVKKNDHERALDEIAQVGAMALAILVDLGE